MDININPILQDIVERAYVIKCALDNDMKFKTTDYEKLKRIKDDLSSFLIENDVTLFEKSVLH